MKVLALLFLAFTAVSAKPSAPDFSKLEDRTMMFKQGEKFLFKNSAEGRIINGEDAEPGQYPWLVALFANSWFCSAALVSPTWVLTAAHCVDGAKSWNLWLGSTDLSKNEDSRQVIKAKRGFVHPDWDSGRLHNDLALIELESPAELNDFVKLSPLAPTSPEAGETVRATGWGKTSDGSTSKSDILKWIDVAVMSESDCQGYYGSYITSDHICIDSINGGVCNGDSGGPLNWANGAGAGETGYSEIGIASFVSGDGCESTAVHAHVYTRVSSYNDWINSYIKS